MWTTPAVWYFSKRSAKRPGRPFNNDADHKIVFWNPQMKEAELARARGVRPATNSQSEEAVKQAVNLSPEVRWTSYVLGAFYWLKKHFPQHPHCGASVYIRSEVPRNKGVSSSAAVEVSVMKAAAACFGIELKGIELAEACQWVENVIADSACGIMDQAASVLGDEHHMLPLLCQPCQPRKLVKLPEQLRCWAIDSGVSHQVTGIEYEAARAAAFIGYRMICEREGLPISESRLVANSALHRFPLAGFSLECPDRQNFARSMNCICRNVFSARKFSPSGKRHPDPFTTIRPEVNYRVRACTRYSIEENQRIELFVELARGSSSKPSLAAFRQMGELMFQSTGPIQNAVWVANRPIN